MRQQPPSGDEKYCGRMATTLNVFVLFVFSAGSFFPLLDIRLQPFAGNWPNDMVRITRVC